MIPSTFSKCLYIHYQKFKSDGSNTHTQAFNEHFSQLCDEQGIAFKVVCPQQVLPEDEDAYTPSWFDELKRSLSQFYLRDFKDLLINIRRMLTEIRLLKAEQPDIVLTRYASNSLSIIWACRWLKIPVVLEFNSPSTEQTSSDYRQLTFFKKLYSNQHALSLANGAFGVSDAIINDAMLTNKGKVTSTIANGVDITLFTPKSTGNQSESSTENAPITIGFVGSFAPWHGLDILIEAFISLLEEGLDVHLLLVGFAKPESRYLLSPLTNPNIAKHVTITGYIEKESVPRFIDKMDIATLPNTEDYCSPLKLFEYMAMAKPTVSVSTAAVEDILRPNEDGLVYQRGDNAQFKAHLKTLITSRQLRESLGQSAQTRVHEQFTWHKNAQNVMELLERVYQAKVDS